MGDSNLVYRRLQEYMHHLPVGFPGDKSGLAIEILKEFFTEDEAKVAVELSMLPESLDRIYPRLKKLGYTKKEAGDILDSMYGKGLVLGGRLLPSGKKKKYSGAQYAIGIFELNVNNLKKNAVGNIIKYEHDTYKDEFFKKGRPVQMRTIPIGKSIKRDNFTATYDDIRQIIDKTVNPIAVINCICREKKDKAGMPCGKSEARETCIMLDNVAGHFIESGAGRVIPKTEVIAMLDKYEDIGLVLQTENSKNPAFICCCCGDCCTVLSMVKLFPVPSEYYSSNYYAVVDKDVCKGCGTCVKRCQMDAITVNDNIAVVDTGRCIGCGLCTSKCQTGAVTLDKKDKIKVPPKSHDALYQNILRKKIGTLNFAKVAVKYLLGMKV